MPRGKEDAGEKEIPTSAKGRQMWGTVTLYFYGTARILPNKPSPSSLIPAEKKRLLVAPAKPPLPKVSVHRPSMEMGWRWLFCSCPRKSPEVGAKALIRPSPKFPTNKALLNLPKLAGARARPQGEFRVPPVAKRRTKSPSALKTSTNPTPAPATSS